MRTTLKIDSDVLTVAKRIAAAQAKTVGEVISDLARKGMETRSKIRRVRGFPVFDVPRDAKPFSLDDIRSEDEEW
jgi:hypothetical protein